MKSSKIQRKARLSAGAVMRAPRFLFLALALLAPAAHADVVLVGPQHIGDYDQTGPFSVRDPVGLNEFASNPTRFHLTQDVLVTGMVLEGFVAANPAPLSGQKIKITFGGRPPQTVTQNGGAITFSPAIPLGAGFRTVAIDPGCVRSGQEFGARCRNQENEYDISFTAIRLLTTGTSLSANIAQRRHIGDSFDYRGDNNFSDAYYPDDFEGSPLVIPFDVTEPLLRLYQIDFSRLRDGARSGQFDSRARAEVLVAATGAVACDFGAIGFERNVNLVSLQRSDCPLPPGAYSLRVTAGQMKLGTSELDKGLDDISWKDIILLFATDVSGVAGRFNAITSDQTNVSAGVIRTQVSGAPLGIDVVALNGGVLLPTYQGTVVVELLDASTDAGTLDNSGCLSSWLLPGRIPLGELEFTLANSGRRTLLVTMEIADVYPKARLLMTDKQFPQSYGCSTDAFAVRPTTYNLSVSDFDWETAGTARILNNVGAAAASPLHKAGRPFTIRATALNAHEVVTSRYTGTPTVVVVQSLLGANAGDFSGGVWSPTTAPGTVQTDSARYNEAGAVRLEVRDTTFAAVDAADTPANERQIGPKTIDVGRFVPDHFNVTYNTPNFAPACGAFTYNGQPFQYSVAPMATLTAVAFGSPPTTTRNYAESLFKLPPNALTGLSTYSALGGHGLSATGLPDPDNALIAAEGVVAVSLLPPANGFVFARPAAPEVPFDAEIQIARVVVDSDGVTTEPSPVAFGETQPGLGIAFAGGANDVRFGRLVVDNAHGSERLPLDVPLRTEYWVGSGGGAGFAHNALDNCTNLPQANAVLTGAFVASNNISVSPMSPSTLVGGKGAIRLTAPSPSQGGQVTVTADLTASLFPWLWIDGDGDNDYNELASADPSAQASFGVFKGDTRRIYQRELVR